MKQDVEKMFGRMPETVRNSNVLSNNSKKVLAGLLYSYSISKPAKTSRVLYISNGKLRKLLEMKYEDMLSSLRELEMYNLIERNAGMARTEGYKPMASEYIIHFDALKKPIEELSFDDIFGDPKSSETPMGTAITITNTITTSITTSNTTSNTTSTTTSNTITTSNTNTNSSTKDNLKYIDINKDNNINIKNDLKYNIMDKPKNYKELSEYIKEKVLALSKDCSTVEEYEGIKNQIILEIEEEYSHIPSYKSCIYSINGYFNKKEDDLFPTGEDPVGTLYTSMPC